MKTEQEIAVLKNLWAIMVSKGKICHPLAQWSVHGSVFELSNLVGAFYPKDYSAPDSVNSLSGIPFSKSQRVVTLAKLTWDKLHDIEKELIAQGKSWIKSLPNPEFPFIKVDWEKTDIPRYYEESEFQSTGEDNRTISIWRGELILKSGDSITLYLDDEDYYAEVSRFRLSIENMRSGKEAEDLAKKVFGDG